MKIGILTHYYKSPNFGGNLQAFALVEFLKQNGFDAEQICYDIFFKREYGKKSVFFFLKKIKNMLSHIISLVKTKILLRKENKMVSKKIKERYSYIIEFNQNKICHSAEFFGYSDIARANSCYDGFITGSDQVWHPNNFCPAYLLSFAEKDKIKISYAASIAKKNLSNDEISRLKESITDYTAVSVREKDSAELLRKYLDKEIACVVDPVFLLTSGEWIEIAQSYSIEEPYLLTYFLGDNPESRNLAITFAKEKKLKLVSMPYLNGAYRKCDWNYGDKQVFDVGPGHFISLIKNASCVFTDSFHATAFSVIFGKNFFVFPRAPQNGHEMTNRIECLLSQCGGEKCFCDTKEKQNLSYLMENVDKQCLNKCDLLNNILFSKQFLLKALRCNLN